MSKISVITPPDKLYNKAYSFVLIYPNNDIKQQLQNLIADWDIPINVYMYEEEAIDWLLDIVQYADKVVLNLDDSDTQIRDLASYLVSLPNVFWLTKAEISVYNKLSVNRIYNLDTLGGTVVLIYPNNDIKQQLQNLIADWDIPINVYMYEEEAIDWLLDIVQYADKVVLNLDDSDTQIRDLASYLVSLPNVFWLTKAEISVYNKLSVNRIYNLDTLGGTVEKKQ